jgi:esterase
MSDQPYFNYRIQGEDSENRWVFMHGLMGYLQNWGAVTRALVPRQTLTYDQRGHGQSFQPKTGYTAQDYASDADQLTRDLGWDQFTLVGHSMGGRNALHFAHLYPEKVKRLIIEDIGPESRPMAHQYYEKMLASVPTPFSSREQVQNFFKNEWKDRFQPKEKIEVLSAFLAANIVEKSPGHWDWRFWPSGIIESVREGRKDESWLQIKNLKCPTLWIRGENSQELSKESFNKILQANSLIQGVVIPEAGHWVHSEKTQAFVQALLAFEAQT